MKSTISKKIFLILFILFFIFILANTALALPTLKDSWGNTKTVAGTAGYSDSNVSIEKVIGDVIQIALSFVGVVFLILMIYGGYLWMTARGEEATVTKAKDLIRAAIIGLIIIVSAYAISYFVIQAIGEGTLNKSSGYNSGGAMDVGDSSASSGTCDCDGCVYVLVGDAYECHNY